jgi:putative tryptophan/tyrosine transport system substrate-binding protein
MPEQPMETRWGRRSFLSRIAVLGSGLPLVYLAQGAPARIRRIGFLNGDVPSLIDAFRGEMRRLGHVEGQNVALDLRVSSVTTSFTAQATELAKSDVELVVAAALPQALAVRSANPAMPMVIATCPGMISNGFAKSLERPGGNVTGMEELPAGITAKRLSLLKTAAPSVSHVALLSTTPGTGGHEAQLADAEQVAPRIGVTVKAYRAATKPELDAALVAIVKDRMNGLLNFQGGLSLAFRQDIVDFVAKHRLPAIYQATLFAEAGGLMAWAPDLEEPFRVAASLVDQILRGANPGDLPIRYPARYFLTIHATTAKNLGITLSPTLLAQADRILH